MLRIFLGFFLLFGVAGTLDVDHNAETEMLCILAATGMALMYSGISSVKFEE